ncbi:MAG TPA: hypothetical protein VK186_00095 [Candidatus Deferrimicrobium sp.]|nr:hypothetical protein [Candidatus Deferrimicrobium sp.]
MAYALEEQIGNPDFFPGRKENLIHFPEWINGIKEIDITRSLTWMIF